ncbi:Rrf2 family transcriptional regulator [Deferribacterales bacterium Es71-Z0220]|jgi:Rrf2 family protein|uniref:RrF2 family transcriptional regulator n=1 Tax=Deferrivibrio essentukiensis TaxID=2880922 RepID=UPI001F6086A0|nr:Rrf2 family transcriptional regulator [Deferrivibrio essentukiensis]MBZ4642762.1 transcriptional regulator, BadM/Rrf2 family [Deferribacteraceae bacterium]MCB4204688.1 Rrf2 family transcriptional regulator [Deferrivibrio essentukiensis]MDK2792187.1 Rrf2 family transcriptional regulator, nitric oxide-sensitive transcriptional repressor [Deferribacteres bacterium]
MKITRAGDYALKVMAYIGSQDKNKLFMRNELSEICGIPDSFLGKILQSLARNNILYSERGKNGGFKFVKEPQEITLYDIIKAVEGEIKINDCLVDPDFCSGLTSCNIHNVLGKIRESFIDELKKYTLENIIQG